MRKRVLVLGWYNKGNVGDEAFKPAFEELFPQADFTFSSEPKDTFKEPRPDVVLVGAGSLLEGDHFTQALPREIPYGIVGVGLPQMTDRVIGFLARARIVVVRDAQSQEQWPKAILAPDIVFGRKFNLPQPPRRYGTTLLLNDFFSPNRLQPAWKQNGYSHFLQQMTTALEERIASHDDHLVFQPMQTGGIDDRRFAGSVISQMTRCKGNTLWLTSEPTEEAVMTRVRASEQVITQRFHGLVYACITGTPVVAICGHDKMWTLARDIGVPTLDYYTFDGRDLPKHPNVSEDKLLAYAEKAWQSWQGIASHVAEKFQL